MSNINDIIENAWLGLGDISNLAVKNPLLHRSEEDLRNPGLHELRMMQNFDYVDFATQTLFNVELLPEQMVVLQEIENHTFPMYVASRGYGKTFTLALYCMLKLALTPNPPGVKVVIVGAAFRQAKLVFEYMEQLWRQGEILRSVCDNNSRPRRDVDRCTMRINGNEAVAIPLGDGSKIRGLRANIILSDEFASISPDVYETVVQGFAAVSNDPISNVKEYARRSAMKELEVWTPQQETEFKSKRGNQIIISGTADYDFKHFAAYWRRYKGIIESKGNPDRLRDFLDDDMIEAFDWEDFCIIRIPYDLVPKGFMDDKVIARAKATVHSGIFALEYGACFIKDSNGFFKRSLIESCVADDKNVGGLHWPQWCSEPFYAMTRGSLDKQYVYGIDPASEQDNFSIVVLELNGEHQRVVYVWTTNRRNYRKRLDAGLTKEHDFYGFCARKIRELMKVFPCTQIAMDAQGGGIAVEEALHDPDKMESGEIPIWPIIDESKEKDTDHRAGLHILELCQFARAEWTHTSNHGLKKDLEDKLLLFPMFDMLTLELANADDATRVKKFEEDNPGKKLTIYDSLEDCVMEIEELKTELSTIIHTSVGTGVQMRDRWDTPETKGEGGRKSRLRKDRYSALLMANMIARTIARKPPQIEYDMVGGFSHELQSNKTDGPMYRGPDWFTKSMTKSLGKSVRRK